MKFLKFLICLYFSTNAHAQTSFTDPSDIDLTMARNSLNSCEILQDIVLNKTSNTSEIFKKLQTEDVHGNLLIDNQDCINNILKFVSSLCSSQSDTNQLFCKSLGFSGIRNDAYKSYGRTVLDDLDLNTNFLSKFDEKAFTFQVAGALFAFTPIKKLRWAKSVLNNFRVKPVINGAMLVLATLGITSCGDIIEPEDPEEVVPSTPCTRNEEGYFEFINTSGVKECIKLIIPTVSYLDKFGNVVTNTFDSPDHRIKIDFKEPVNFVAINAFDNLDETTALQMLSIKLADIDIVESGFKFKVDVSNDESYFVLTPEVNYYGGDYTVGVSNFAPKDKAFEILAGATGRRYLNEIKTKYSAISSFALETPCTKGDSGYFEFPNSNGLINCIKQITPTVSYLKDGNPVKDTSNLSDHSIKVTFNGLVSFINSDRHEALTDGYAREMIELNLNGNNILNKGFEAKFETGVQNGNSYFILTPEAVYPIGDYLVKVKNYVSSEDASYIVRSDRIDDYLDLVNNKYSNFSTLSFEEFCANNSYGYFSLQYEDGVTDCIKIPEVVFTFTPMYGLGREKLKFGFDPYSTIKIYFDSEVVYLQDDGSFRDISKEDILEMVEISGNGEANVIRTLDIVGKGKHYDVDVVSVANENGKTVITIESPYDPEIKVDLDFYTYEKFNLIVKNFANKSDVTKIVNSNSLNSYLKNVATYYNGEVRFYERTTSCGFKTSSSSSISYDVQNNSTFKFICDVTNEMSFESLKSKVDIMADGEGFRFEKAEPNAKYIIDVGLIVSDELVAQSSGDWREYIENDVMNTVNRMFQDSGLKNVEFRTSLVSPFSELKQYLLCPNVPSLSKLQQDVSAGYFGIATIAMELRPILRKKYPIDIMYIIYDNPKPELGGGGTAWGKIYPGNFNRFNRHGYSRYGGFGASTAYRNNMLDIIGNSTDITSSNTYFTALVVAHEIGHILGLNHDVDTDTNRGYPPRVMYDALGSLGTIFEKAWGYGGNDSAIAYGTIMSYADYLNAYIPLFSADREVSLLEACGDQDRIDNVSGLGYCPSSANLSGTIKLGGPYKSIIADATEVMRHTIQIASESSDLAVAPPDILSSFSNGISVQDFNK